MTGKPSIDELLDTLAAKAPALRKAGVREVTLEGISFKLGEPEVEWPKEKDEDPVTYSNPLDDPRLYPGGKVPSFKRPGS